MANSKGAVDKSLRDRIVESGRKKRDMIKKFGFVPASILKLSRGALSRSMFSMQHETPARNSETQQGYRDKLERLKDAGYTKAAPSNRKAGRGTLGLSIMPAEIVEFFAKYYGSERCVYLDPFMGHGIRMQVAKHLGFDYYGYDMSAEFFKYIESVKKKIDDTKTVMQITHGDSRSPDEVPDNIGDFSFYSPPYWDIEYYGDEEGQLGIDTTYEEFLDGMRDVARAWLSKFKCDAFHCVNVNDFRKDKKFYPYHADLIKKYQEAGWQLHDTWIVDGLVGGTPRAFAVSFNEMQIAPKVHEYVLVFQKRA